MKTYLLATACAFFFNLALAVVQNKRDGKYTALEQFKKLPSYHISIAKNKKKIKKCSIVQQTKYTVLLDVTHFKQIELTYFIMSMSLNALAKTYMKHF